MLVLDSTRPASGFPVRRNISARCSGEPSGRDIDRHGDEAIAHDGYLKLRPERSCSCYGHSKPGRKRVVADEKSRRSERSSSHIPFGLDLQLA